ncbi:MAG: nucleotidyl transferase AbiEii/AbiGii toxin family protein [Patescibacteria group bacterium]|mgnify:CR=1 FL=1
MNFFTKGQQLIWDQFKKDEFLRSTFYFTGGTALTLIYLHHRESEDLDFFSEQPFDTQITLDKVSLWSEKFNIKVKSRSIEKVQMFDFTFPDEERLKIDFNHYPYKRMEKGKNVEKVIVDSLLDIAINKLLTTNQRTEVKDFVDLYFLLQEFTVWTLMDGVKVKFRVELEPVIVGGDFLKIEEFDTLPKMLVPLSLKKLQNFYREQAKRLGMHTVKK